MSRFNTTIGSGLLDKFRRQLHGRNLRRSTVFLGFGLAVLAAFGISSAATLTTDAAGATYTFIGSGDIAMTQTKAEATAKLLDEAVVADPNAVVWTTGDNVYDSGTDSEFSSLYAPTWGRHRSRTKPTPGNHEYQTSGATGYYKYFCPSATDCVFPGGTQKKYYSYDVGNWHIIALNSEVEYQAGSAQLTWLQQDLAANPGKCVAALWHKPYFNSGISHGRELAMRPFWDVLYAAKVDIVLNGHEHIYERFAKQSPAGVAAADGIRQFTVGTGGASLNTVSTVLPNSQVRQGHTEGVLKLSLSDGSYQWAFVPVAGKTFTDSGSDGCNNATGDAFPAASITTPANEAVVKGTAVTVAANADDDNGVAGVQFQLDGNVLGSEVTVAPYDLSWDTTSATEGRHTLTAVVRDSAGKTSTSLPVSVTVDNVIDTTVVIEKRTAASSDDAEQPASGGATNLNSTDLELTTDTSNQLVGMRFSGVAVPRGAIIKNAYVQFATDETGSAATTLSLRGHATDNAASFTTASNDILNRSRTTASVGWTPTAWNTLGEAGPGQRTPDLSSVIGEITRRGNWNSGNALALIISGSGKRVASAYDGSPSDAPLLHIEYEIDRTAPTEPTNLAASSPSSSQVNLTWSAATDDTAVAGYRIFRDGAAIGTSTSLSFADSGRSPNTAYSYEVEAFDSVGNTSARSAPVTITTPAAIPQTFTFRPAADATIKSSSAGSKFGTASSLETDNSPIIDFLLKFNVTGLAGKSITSAKLSLYNTDGSAAGGRLFRTNSTSWAENNVSWNNAPAADPSPFATFGSVTPNAWHEVSVMPVVTGDGTYSFRMKSTSSDNAIYRSKEAGTTTAPVLTIVAE